MPRLHRNIARRVLKFIPNRRRHQRRRVRMTRWKGRKATIYQGVSTQANIPRFQRFRYVDTVNIDPGAGVVGSHYFSCNNLFDPDVTGAGHQPLRYNEMKKFYNHYIVVGSKINVQRVGQYATSIGSTPVVWGVYVDDSTTPPVGAGTIMESGRSRYTMTNSTNAQGRQALNAKFSCKKFFNVSNIKDNVDRLGAQMNASPADQAYYFIWAIAHDFAGDPPVATYIVTIDFAAILSEPVDLVTS